MGKPLEIKVTGTGDRKLLSDALHYIANQLWSENNIEEIYDIDGCTYMEQVNVILIDPEALDTGEGYQTTDKSEGGVN